MWNKIFNIVIWPLPPLYLAMKATCPLCMVVVLQCVFTLQQFGRLTTMTDVNQAPKSIACYVLLVVVGQLGKNP